MDGKKQKLIFDEWLSQHKGIFFKIVRSYAFNLHDQEDLFQEISLQVWRSIPNFKGEAKESTWIYRVALYAASTWVREEKKQPLTQQFLESPLLQLNQQPKDERVDWLYEQIGLLDPIDRSLCLLLFDGFAYKEMAEMLGISESNVGVKIHRLKQHLTRLSQEKVN